MGSRLFRRWSCRARSKLLPLTDRVALAAEKGGFETRSPLPRKVGEREKPRSSMALLHTFYLEHLGPPAGPPMQPPMPGLSVSTALLGVDDYLTLFREVGGPIGWDGRTEMARDDLAAFLANPKTQIFVLNITGARAGFCEFSSADAPESEIVYFGLIPPAQGQKLGPYLLDYALRAHWKQHAPQRVWLHTDEWDGPRAVDTYKRAGFRVFGERRLDEDATYRDYRAARDALTAGQPDA